MRKLSALLPHLCIILSGMLLTFFILDQINPAMAFINNEITKWLMLLQAVLTIICCILLIIFQRRKRKE